MVATQFLIASVIAAASATSLAAREDAFFASLLKRQEPGTPAYNCHDNCGSAITLSKGSDPCTNALFLADYKNCLQCSGPDNYNIWRYYGGTLSSAGEKCGLDTEPLAGKQDDVPAAGSTAASSSAAASETPAAPSSAASSAAVSSAPAPSSTAPVSSAAATSEVATSEAPVSSASPSASAVLTTAITSAPLYPTTIANGTLSSVSGVPSPSSNSSASFTASTPAEVTANAAAGLHTMDAAGVFGAIFVGALFGM